MICYNPLLPGLLVHAFPVLNHDHTDQKFTKKTNGVLEHSKSSVNQLLLYDVITLPANSMIMMMSGIRLSCLSFNCNILGWKTIPYIFFDLVDGVSTFVSTS